VEDVIRIFAKVSENIGARLLMIGDGPDRHTAFQLASSLGISGRVAFLGSFPRIEDLLGICDLFLLPSIQESFGLAALEAMASGVPVIAAKTGGIPEVVEDGVSGFLYDQYDVEAMAQGAISLLSNPELHQQFSKAARDRAVTHFTEHQIVPMYEKAYEEALERRLVSSGK
jgi:N-acetyl-alpha-D-glucosaminyl L-malate synthase BshA